MHSPFLFSLNWRLRQRSLARWIAISRTPTRMALLGAWVVGVHLFAADIANVGSADISAAYSEETYRAPLFPIPKHIEWGRDDLLLADEHGPRAAIFIDSDASARAKLGAEEISARCAELSGTRLRVETGTHLTDQKTANVSRIMIGRAGSSLIDGCLRTHQPVFSGKYALGKESPGEQGYILRYFRDREGRRCVLIGGSDEQGTLYGCYSFLQLMRKKAGRALAVQADISDFPDFKYRGVADLYSLGASLWRGRDDFPYEKWMREYIDFLAKRKVNVIRHYPSFPIANPPDGAWEKRRFGELNNYARQRGVYLWTLHYWNLGTVDAGTGLVPVRANCGAAQGRRVGGKARGSVGCCYGDDMLRKQAETLKAFCERFRPLFLSFHYIDCDPYRWKGKESWWPRRCDVCKAKYGDTERWRADADMINSAFNAIRKGCKDTLVEATLWPYHARIVTGEWQFFPGSGETHRKYLGQLLPRIPDEVFITLRECGRPEVETWDAATRGHRKFVHYYPYDGFGYWVASWGRDFATWHTGNRDDGIVVTGARQVCFEVAKLITAQYAWTVKTPGYKIWNDRKELRKYNGTGKPAREPRFVHDVLVPLICRNIYGKEAAPYLEKALKTNIERGLPGTRGGWHRSRWKVDVEGKKRAENGELIDPVQHYAAMTEEAETMYRNMQEAVRRLPEDEFQQWVIRTIWYKSRELLNRCRGFHHWSLSAGHKQKGEDGKAQQELDRALACLDEERRLMQQTEQEGYPADVTTQLGYVPYFRKPWMDARKWAKNKGLTINGPTPE